MSDLITADDLLFYKEDGKMMSGGFNIHSILLKSGISPMIGGMNITKKKSTSNTAYLPSFSIENLAIPAGLLYQSFTPQLETKKEMEEKEKEKEKEKHKEDENEERKYDIISDELYNQLIDLVQFKKNASRKRHHHTTSSSTSISHKKTKRRYDKKK